MRDEPFPAGPGGDALTVRDATPEDMAAVQAIYAHHVRHGLATFEVVPPTLEEMSARLQAVRRAGLPWLVALAQGQVVGYAYASAYRPRPAYRHTVEDSVYVAHDRAGQGIGRVLLAGLIACCERGPWRQMVAVVGDSGNTASLQLHRRLGFREVGTLASVGYKLGRWVDTVILQRALGEGDATPPEAAAIPRGGA